MAYATQPPHPGRQSPRGAAYRRAVAEVRARALAGEPCWFWQVRPECPGGWDWTLPTNDAWAFTVHHLHRLMDGGEPEPEPDRMAPAHRGCNAWDGLRAQNARRRGEVTARAVSDPAPERTSRAW